MNRPLRHGKGLKEILQKGNKFLKDSKLISRTLDRVAGDSKRGGKEGILWVKPLSMLAKSYGYGPKRRTVRRTRRVTGMRRGRGFFDWIKNKALPWLKKTKLISTVGNALAPIPGIGNIAGTIGKVAGMAGYGRRKYVGRPRGRGVIPKTVGRGKRRVRRGRGIGHMYTPQSGVGIAGTAQFSRGRVQF